MNSTRLATALTVACLIATPAPAQLASPSGGAVSVNAPSAGAAVRGTVTIGARVSETGAFGVTAVSFQVDGVAVAEDTSPPYAIEWDSRTVADGWHTIVALARDARGLQFASDPVQVTVANAVPPARPVVRFEQNDAATDYSPGWTHRNREWFGWSGGNATESFVPGARAVFSFTGTSVSWIGYRSGNGGIARVSIDGARFADVDLFAKTDEVGVPVFSAAGLTDSAHTLTIEVTGLKNPESFYPIVLVDAFDVPAMAVSRLQETDPALVYAAGWTQGERSKSWSGSAAATSATPGARTTLSFNGTSIRWRGYRGPDAGIARVYVDGGFAGEIDLYSPIHGVQDVVFAADGLANGDHTLAIEATGRSNSAASGAAIVIDAFDVANAGRRIEETDAAIAYGGDWIHANRNRTWSGATAAESNVDGARATLAFTATAVRWIGLRGRNTGIARVYLDGALAGEVDTYAPSEGPQNTLFAVDGLPDAKHTLTIEATGRKNPSANFAWIVVDAFDVRP